MLCYAVVAIGYVLTLHAPQFTAARIAVCPYQEQRTFGGSYAHIAFARMRTPIFHKST